MAGPGDWLDGYERTARLTPGLLSATPILVAVLAVGLRNDPVIVGFLGLVAAVGVPVAIANLVRERGQRLQEGMWVRWGGSPTIALLRVAGGQPDALRDSRRQSISAATKLKLPEAADELNDRVGSDRTYEAVVRALITRTRERPRFELVFKENQSYGYWRNLLGIRSIGIAVAVASIVVLLALLVCEIAFGLGLTLLDLGLGITACGIGVAFWIWVPTEERVKRAAISYAERLLDAAALVQ